MVFSLFTAADHRGLYFYSNPLGAELDRKAGDQSLIKRPADPDHDPAC